MRISFGPWSSALGDESSAQLSTFWKRRMALLPSAHQARSALTRRDYLRLGAAGVATLAVPTLRLASAAVSRSDVPREDKPEALPGRIFVKLRLAGPDPVNPDAGSRVGVVAVVPETGDWQVVVENVGHFMWYRVSPDGRTIALTTPDNEVWIGDSTGRKAPVPIDGKGKYPVWSPDGNQIITHTWTEPPGQGYTFESWRFNADGSNLAKLPIAPKEQVDDWSPDGRWFVISAINSPGRGQAYHDVLYVTHPDGTGRRLLTDKGAHRNILARFSPDSRTIAYIHHAGEIRSIWRVNIDGSDRREVFRDPENSADMVCWSPDGKWLAVKLAHVTRDENGQGALEGDGDRVEIMDADGKRRRTLHLPPNQFIGNIDWK